MKAKRVIAVMIPLTIVFLFANVSSAYDEYWPTKKWRTSKPEKQGMDSEKLLKINEYVKE